MKCFYHKSDLDGHCSGAIVKLKFPECEMIGVDYQDSLESLGVELEPGENIIVVDFTFQPDDMYRLASECGLIWIDHHKTSIDWAHKNAFLATIQSLEIGKAGCELAWEFFHTDEKMPTAVKLLGRYDVWDHSDERTLPFQWGLRAQADTLPDNDFFWKQIFYSKRTYLEILTAGKTIIDYQRVQDEKYARGMAYEAEFEGLRAIVMNKSFANSKAFESVYDPEKHDIMILFGVKPGKCKYSLFCDKPDIDVSAIAKKYGGGGHRGAAGFYAASIIQMKLAA